MGALCTHTEEPVSGKKPILNKVDKSTQQILNTYSPQQNQLNFVLAYWDIRGIAQVSRFLLEYLGFKYTNKVYNEPQSWFGQDKLKLNSTFPNLPYLSFEQTIITESQAIEEFIIKKSNEAGKLLGQDQKTKAQIWMLIGVIKELFQGVIGQTFKETYEEEKQQNFEQKFQDKLNLIHSFLGNKKKFLLGNISYPDFLLYELILYIKRMYPQEYENLYKNTFDNFSNNFEQLEKIQTYIKSNNYPKKFLPSNSKFNYDIDSQQKVNNIQNVNIEQQNINVIVQQKNQILTLAYWKMRGKVQILIFLIEYLQLEYQMKYYTDRDEWFNQDKNNIHTDFPNLPYMIDNGYVLTETLAIAQYLIQKSGKQNELLSASDLIKQATLNMLLGVLLELQNDIINMCLQKNKFDELRIKNYQQNYHFKLKYLRNYLGDKVYLLGSISLADFLLYEVLQYVKKIYYQQYVQFFKEAFEKFENEFLQIQQIKKYVEKAKQNNEFTIFLPSQISEFTGNEFFDSFEYSEPQNHQVITSPQKSSQQQDEVSSPKQNNDKLKNQNLETHVIHQQLQENHVQLNDKLEQQQIESPQKVIQIHNEQQSSQKSLHDQEIQQQNNEQNDIKQQSNSPQNVIQEQIQVNNIQQSPQKIDQIEQTQVHQEINSPAQQIDEKPIILGYWDFRGRAQPIRSLLKYLKLKYENKIYLEPQQWHEGDKTNLNIQLPNLPYIIDNGIKLTESDAIVEYIINKSGRQDQLLKRQDPKLASQILMISSVIKEIFEELFSLMLKIQNKDNFESNRISKYRSFFHSKVTQLHDFLGENNFLFGNQLTLPDIYFQEFLQYFTKLYQQQYDQYFKKSFDRFFQAYYQIEEFQENDPFSSKYLPNQFNMDFSNMKFENFELNQQQLQQEEIQVQSQEQEIAQKQEINIEQIQEVQVQVKELQLQAQIEQNVEQQELKYEQNQEQPQESAQQQEQIQYQQQEQDNQQLPLIQHEQKDELVQKQEKNQVDEEKQVQQDQIYENIQQNENEIKEQEQDLEKDELQQQDQGQQNEENDQQKQNQEKVQKPKKKKQNKNK